MKFQSPLNMRIIEVLALYNLIVRAFNAINTKNKYPEFIPIEHTPLKCFIIYRAVKLIDESLVEKPLSRLYGSAQKILIWSQVVKTLEKYHTENPEMFRAMVRVLNDRNYFALFQARIISAGYQIKDLSLLLPTKQQTLINLDLLNKIGPN